MIKLKLSKFITFLLIFAFLLVPNKLPNQKTYAVSDEPKISSKAAILVDYESDTIIFEKNSNERLPIASMTKLASLSIILDYLRKGVIKENDYVLVSETAAGIGGSSAFLDAGSKYKVSELIKTVIIASANDSTVALAEFVSGSEEMFVSKMNKLCLELGLENTHFENSTGLPSENHFSSARDMVKIYKTVCNNPLYKEYAKIWMSDFIHPSGRKTGLVNTNRLVRTYDGIDGGKTGYTNAARFCLTASATRGETRLIGVLIGSNDSKTRFAEMSSLFNYGFSNFENKLLIDKEVPVTLQNFKNAKNSVSLYPEESVNKFLNKSEEFIYSTGYEVYDLKSPIKKGDVVGKMFVFDKNNMVVSEVNLVSGEDVKEIGFKELFGKIVNLW